MNPEKIEKFWEITLEKTSSQPLDAIAEKVAVPVPYEKYKVAYKSFGGWTIKAFLSRPIIGETVPGRLPAIVTAPGYGGWEHGVTLCECQRGYVIMQVYPRDQGESGNLLPGVPRKGPWPLMTGIVNPEGYYYQGAFMDMVRAVDYLITRPDVDPERIGIMGTSQGGGIALSVAGIDSRLKACVAHVPFFCDMRNNSAYKGSELDNPAYLDTTDYFDPANLAYRIKAPTLLSSGGRDVTCPSDTIRAVFDRLSGIKALAHYPDLTHTTCGAFYGMSWDWMEKYL